MKIKTILLASMLVLGISYETSAQNTRAVSRDSNSLTKPLPDLTIGKVTIVDAFTVRLDVLNMGEADAPASTATLYIYDANNKLIETESTEVPALAPGPPVFVIFDGVGGDSGIYGKRYQVMVDSKYKIRESNEINNRSRVRTAR